MVGVQANWQRDERGVRKHGHMVTVRPEAIPGLAENYQEKLAKSGTSRQILPMVNNIGSRITVESAATAFPEEVGPVHYYTPRKR